MISFLWLLSFRSRAVSADPPSSRLCCVLLSPVAALPGNSQKRALASQLSFIETGHPLNMLSNQLPRPARISWTQPPSLSPLPEYLSSLALEVALGEAGCQLGPTFCSFSF